jgi:hypothetical protein
MAALRTATIKQTVETKEVKSSSNATSPQSLSISIIIPCLQTVAVCHPLDQWLADAWGFGNTKEETKPSEQSKPSKQQNSDERSSCMHSTAQHSTQCVLVFTDLCATDETFHLDSAVEYLQTTTPNTHTPSNGQTSPHYCLCVRRQICQAYS